MRSLTDARVGLHPSHPASRPKSTGFSVRDEFLSPPTHAPLCSVQAFPTSVDSSPSADFCPALERLTTPPARGAQAGFTTSALDGNEFRDHVLARSAP